MTRRVRERYGRNIVYERREKGRDGKVLALYSDVNSEIAGL